MYLQQLGKLLDEIHCKGIDGELTNQERALSEELFFVLKNEEDRQSRVAE